MVHPTEGCAAFSPEAIVLVVKVFSGIGSDRGPWAAVSHHGVEDDQEFVHTGGDCHLIGFALGLEALEERLDYGIAADRVEGGHVERGAHLGTAATDGPRLAAVAAFVVEGSQAN